MRRIHVQQGANRHKGHCKTIDDVWRIVDYLKSIVSSIVFYAHCGAGNIAFHLQILIDDGAVGLQHNLEGEASGFNLLIVTPSRNILELHEESLASLIMVGIDSACLCRIEVIPECGQQAAWTCSIRDRRIFEVSLQHCNIE